MGELLEQPGRIKAALAPSGNPPPKEKGRVPKGAALNLSAEAFGLR
jgi:hypothetical protein